ncbi:MULTISPECIES: hypothetical protein [unclassified Paenibacillus]|uniref:hypothetical protein n=1 Tax=unclassified Paenibacillus TaxID=185978 RepID=UPI0024070585|nr:MULTISPECIES: hypothetical protein [unclassified Paenibacillus]MDF9845188.1 chromosome segregation ATPase [Paenibacillus sp. PastF-2]MDF9850320.1 chromosome segregation ATPase [Paenibacillus sp. PastM-2]MDF9856977.1 chromosome segregation ATPase [Paenibacillus sp. PastF-1]MDH6482166.1 chromosome segregation ATPase [Paenibacillus sp. PastH-2]MDH6509670.1 chromosome segregation ATPase [Paenibacillus sp. PastM-3]
MRRGGQSGTPIPNRAVEHQSYGTGSVKEYTLTPEQLEEIRQKYPVTKRDKKFKAPIEIKTKLQEEKRMGKFTMTEAEFKAARESGKTIAQIAKEQDVTEVTVYNSMRRWEASEKGQNEQKLLREKDAAPPADTQQLDKAIHEIERLTLEVAAKGEANKILQARLESAETEEKKWKEQAGSVAAARDSAQEELVEAYEERDMLRDEINRMITERDELVAENDRLERRMVEAQGEATRAWSEVEELRDTLGHPMLAEVHKPSESVVLDTAIADLTRARWILNRLTASGE